MPLSVYTRPNWKGRYATFCGRRFAMAVKKNGEKFHCTVCGNEVIVTKVGGGTLVCCKKEMQEVGD
jgi:desulfoferrodoxin-like iron-binding protein